MYMISLHSTCLTIDLEISLLVLLSLDGSLGTHTWFMVPCAMVLLLCSLKALHYTQILVCMFDTILS